MGQLAFKAIIKLDKGAHVFAMIIDFIILVVIFN